MKRERGIQQVRAQSNITYAEAVKLMSQGKEYGERSGTGRRLTVESEQAIKGKVMIDFKRLVTFIAGAVNTTMEVKSKT